MTWHPTATRTPRQHGEMTSWPVDQIMWNGARSEVASFASFASAESYAQTIAESIARSDRERAWRGVLTSGIQAITVGWDVWDIPALVLGRPAVRPVADTVPPEQARGAAYALAMQYRDTMRYPGRSGEDQA